MARTVNPEMPKRFIVLSLKRNETRAPPLTVVRINASLLPAATDYCGSAAPGCFSRTSSHCWVLSLPIWINAGASLCVRL